MHELLTIVHGLGASVALAGLCAMAVLPVRLCGALTSNGTNCRRAAYPGGTRCNLHGGASPQAIAGAQRFLDRARMPAIEAMNDIILTFLSARCELCGNPTGDAHAVIKACTAVLDRTGLHPSLTVKHTHGDSEPDEWMAYLTDAELAEFSAWSRRVQALAEARMDAPSITVLPVNAQAGVLVERGETEDDKG
jgi:hypothetical protein